MGTIANSCSWAGSVFPIACFLYYGASLRSSERSMLVLPRSNALRVHAAALMFFIELSF